MVNSLTSRLPPASSNLCGPYAELPACVHKRLDNQLQPATSRCLTLNTYSLSPCPLVPICAVPIPPPQVLSPTRSQHCTAQRRAPPRWSSSTISAAAVTVAASFLVPDEQAGMHARSQAAAVPTRAAAAAGCTSQWPDSVCFFSLRRRGTTQPAVGARDGEEAAIGMQTRTQVVVLYSHDRRRCGTRGTQTRSIGRQTVRVRVNASMRTHPPPSLARPLWLWKKEQAACPSAQPPSAPEKGQRGSTEPCAATLECR